jgi:serine phosphatase RsbU (regulator of sigma subunit)
MCNAVLCFSQCQALSLTNFKSLAFCIVFIFAIQQKSKAQSQGPAPEILRLYQEAEGNKDYPRAAKFAYEIAKTYNEAKDSPKALDYLNQALAHAKKSRDQGLLYSVSHQLGVYYTDAKKYAKALENFQSALTTSQKMNDAILMKGELLNIAITYSYLEKFKKSIEFAEEALSLALTNNDTLLQQRCYQLLSEYHNKQGNTKKSVEYKAQLNLLIAAQQNNALKTRQINELEEHILTVGLEKEATQAKLSEQNKRLQQTNASLRMTESTLQQTTHSLLATTDSLKQIEAISRNRQLEIDLLQKNNELADIKIKEQDARIKNEAIVRNAIMVATLLSVALIAVLIISYRKKHKDNKKIEQQNKNIKSSINYAKRIQEAMLPKIEQYPQILDNSFVLFQPRDTVSGDFYWFSDIKQKSHADAFAFAAVDCTGHGVPGAFMSMIGINVLNGLVNQGITKSNVLLESLDHEIRTALKQEVSGNNDGMDVALCIYRQSEKILEFAGAKNPLIYIQNNKLFQVKGDIHPIGGRKKVGHDFTFKKHEISISEPTIIYLYSDGYKHQFGGEHNAKYSAKNLNKLLLEIHHLPMQEQKVILHKNIEEWKGTRQQTDDILVMGLRLG